MCAVEEEPNEGGRSPDVSSGRRSILVPHGEKMKVYGCLRSLNRRGIHTVVASERAAVPNFSSRFCSESVTLSSHDLLSYRDALLELAARPDVESILPVRERDVYLFAKYRREFEEEVSLVTPTAETLERCHDRLRLAREAVETGVPVPETRLLSEIDRCDDRSVIKSRYNLLTNSYVDSVSSNVAEEIKTVRFLQPGEIPDVDSIRDTMGHDPIVQEFIPQSEKYLYCALWDHGEPVASYQHKQIRQNSWLGGGGVYRESVYSEAVEQVARDLLRHLEWHGLVCIEYLKDARTGEWKLLEINPRVWQSMPEAVRAGADFPYYYWLLANDQPEKIDPTYDLGVKCHNAYGELEHLRSLFRDELPYSDPPSFGHTLANVVFSSLVHPRFEFVRLDDPKLLLRSIRQAFASGGTSDRQYDVYPTQ